MPVKAENLALYPGGSLNSPEWRAIHKRIQERAGNRCELCNVRNHALVYRSICGDWYRYDYGPIGQYKLLHSAPFPASKAAEVLYVCDKVPAELAWRANDKPVKIICTTAHLNHDPTDNRDDNLKFLCQSCHNRDDAAHRSKNARRTRKAKA